jgi:hypothetical protein
MTARYVQFLGVQVVQHSRPPRRGPAARGFQFLIPLVVLGQALSPRPSVHALPELVEYGPVGQPAEVVPLFAVELAGSRVLAADDRAQIVAVRVIDSGRVRFPFERIWPPPERRTLPVFGSQESQR